MLKSHLCLCPLLGRGHRGCQLFLQHPKWRISWIKPLLLSEQIKEKLLMLPLVARQNHDTHPQRRTRPPDINRHLFTSLCRYNPQHRVAYGPEVSLSEELVPTGIRLSVFVPIKAPISHNRAESLPLHQHKTKCYNPINTSHAEAEGFASFGGAKASQKRRYTKHLL